MDSLISLVYYDGITIFEALCRFCVIMLSVDAFAAICYAIMRGFR